jgi:hypothetical protein
MILVRLPGGEPLRRRALISMGLCAAQQNIFSARSDVLPREMQLRRAHKDECSPRPFAKPGEHKFFTTRTALRDSQVSTGLQRQKSDEAGMPQVKRSIFWGVRLEAKSVLRSDSWSAWCGRARKQCHSSRGNQKWTTHVGKIV